jgi:ribonuclease HI
LDQAERDRVGTRQEPDLWAELLALVEARDVTFWWVRGHAGDEYNERCDALAAAAYRQPGLPPDHGYAR